MPDPSVGAQTSGAQLELLTHADVSSVYPRTSPAYACAGILSLSACSEHREVATYAAAAQIFRHGDSNTTTARKATDNPDSLAPSKYGVNL